MRESIPPVHKKILDIYKRFVKSHGYQPTYEQVGQVLNISRTAVGQHIRYMERDGLVCRPLARTGRDLILLR